MAKSEKGKDETRSVTPWRPWAEVARMERDMERMFDDFFTPRWSLFRPGRFLGRRGGAVAMPSVDVDVYEKKDEIVARAELPGMSKDEINVNVTDHMLTIRGEKKKEEEVKDEDYYYSERSFGSFMRTVELPAEVQTDKAKASFKNGVLEIRLPKTEEAKKKEIPVNID
jgi:HSP20 family protein